jgi:hypothetical protein
MRQETRFAPRGTYWRGDVLWGRRKTKGRDIRWSLHTDDPKVAATRRRGRVLPDPKALKARVAGLRLSADEHAFLFDAIDAAIIRLRQGARARTLVAHPGAQAVPRGTGGARGKADGY